MIGKLIVWRQGLKGFLGTVELDLKKKSGEKLWALVSASSIVDSKIFSKDNMQCSLTLPKEKNRRNNQTTK